MKLDKEMEEYIKYLLRAIIYITGLYYIAYLIPVIKNPDSFLTIISEATINYFKTLSLPITITGVTIAQFNIAYNNREIARKKALIELEEKTIKGFLEIKELLEGIVSTNNDSYFQLLNNMKIKDKLIEEKY